MMYNRATQKVNGDVMSLKGWNAIASFYLQIVAEDARAEERRRLCDSGCFAWYCEVRTLALYHALMAKEPAGSGTIGGKWVSEWWDDGWKERFHPLPRAQRPR